MGESGHRGHRRHDDDDGAPLARSRRSRDEGADALREAGGIEAGGDHEHRGHDDGRLARKARQRFGRREDSGEIQGQQGEHRRQVDAHPIADEQRQRSGQDDEKNQLLRVHVGPGARKSCAALAATLQPFRPG